LYGGMATIAGHVSATDAEHVRMARVAEQQVTNDQSSRNSRPGCMPRITCASKPHHGSDTSIQGHTLACIITIVEINHQVMGDNLSLLDMDAHSSKTDLPCLPELSGTTVLTKSLGAAKLPNSPAWLELLHSSVANIDQTR